MAQPVNRSGVRVAKPAWMVSSVPVACTAISCTFKLSRSAGRLAIAVASSGYFPENFIFPVALRTAK